MAKKKNKTNLTNAFLGGAIDKVLNVLPDATEALVKGIENAAPIVDKALDRKYEAEKQLITLPNMINMSVDSAQEHLEKIGFLVATIIEKPDKKWINKRPNEVVKMSPNNGKFKAGTLIKLYYVTSDIIDQSDGEVTIPILADMMVDEAIQLLEKKGLVGSKILAKPAKEFASKKVGLVIDSDPKSNLLNKVVKQGTVVRLTYLDEEVIAQSKKLLEKHKKEQKAQKQAFDDAIGNVQKTANNIVNNGQKAANDVLKNGQKIADGLVSNFKGILPGKKK